MPARRSLRRKRLSRARAAPEPESKPVAVTKMSYDWMPAWIAAFQESRSVTAACDAVGIHRSTAYRARDENPDFADAWSECVQRVKDALKSTMLGRAIDGDVRPVTLQKWGPASSAEGLDDEGKPRAKMERLETEVVWLREFDTPLQKFLAERMMPEEFGDQAEADEGAKERAARACALIETMQGSVPKWDEEAEDADKS